MCPPRALVEKRPDDTAPPGMKRGSQSTAPPVPVTPVQLSASSIDLNAGIMKGIRTRGINVAVSGRRVGELQADVQAGHGPELLKLRHGHFLDDLQICAVQARLRDAHIHQARALKGGRASFADP